MLPNPRANEIGDTGMFRLFLTATLALVSTAASADYKTDCLDSKNHDLRIKGCSAMIQRNPNDVLAYQNRGDAYGLKGEVDRAISDYNKAIELNPNYAPAYTARGRAYTSKGDYTRLSPTSRRPANSLRPRQPSSRLRSQSLRQRSNWGDLTPCARAALRWTSRGPHGLEAPLPTNGARRIAP
jgi:tetratricopeptide (TPR) repeat protein